MRGLTLDKVCDNVVVDISGVNISKGNTFDEQIAANEQKAKLEKKSPILKRWCGIKSNLKRNLSWGG